MLRKRGGREESSERVWMMMRKKEEREESSERGRMMMREKEERGAVGSETMQGGVSCGRARREEWTQCVHRSLESCCGGSWHSTFAGHWDRMWVARADGRGGHEVAQQQQSQAMQIIPL